MTDTEIQVLAIEHLPNVEVYHNHLETSTFWEWLEWYCYFSIAEITNSDDAKRLHAAIRSHFVN